MLFQKCCKSFAKAKYKNSYRNSLFEKIELTSLGRIKMANTSNTTYSATFFLVKIVFTTNRYILIYYAYTYINIQDHSYTPFPPPPSKPLSPTYAVQFEECLEFAPVPLCVSSTTQSHNRFLSHVIILKFRRSPSESRTYR